MYGGGVNWREIFQKEYFKYIFPVFIGKIVNETNQEKHNLECLAGSAISCRIIRDGCNWNAMQMSLAQSVIVLME